MINLPEPNLERANTTRNREARNTHTMQWASRCGLGPPPTSPAKSTYLGLTLFFPGAFAGVCFFEDPIVELLKTKLTFKNSDCRSSKIKKVKTSKKKVGKDNRFAKWLQ